MHKKLVYFVYLASREFSSNLSFKTKIFQKKKKKNTGEMNNTAKIVIELQSV